MGLIRLLLSISVVLVHSYGFALVGGRLAVQLFYMVSGYLISYVLIEGRSYKTVRPFYINRFIRLYPMYICVAIITLIYYFSFESASSSLTFFNTYRSIDKSGGIALILANLVIFGQDWIMFTGSVNGVFKFVSDFQSTDFIVWHGLIVPQAWTLGVELSFYLIAPFVLRNRRYMFLLFFASCILRVSLVIYGVGSRDPWTYRFFPTELALFLLGAISHQILSVQIRKRGPSILSRFSSLVVYGFFIYILVFPYLPMRFLQGVLIVLFFFLALPFFMDFQKSRPWDRFLGEFSYPVYISHILVVYVFSDLQLIGLEDASLEKVFMLLVATLLFSWALIVFVGRPFEKYRALMRD